MRNKVKDISSSVGLYARKKAVLCGIIVFVLLSNLIIECSGRACSTKAKQALQLLKGRVNRNPNTKYCTPHTEHRITIGVDDSVLQKLSRYPISAKVNFASSNSTGKEKLRNLPRHPSSKKILSVTQETSDIFIYETRQNAKSAARYFVREMKRRGWNLYSGRGLASQPLLAGETFLFHNKGEAKQPAGRMCLFHAESDSGMTTITVVYFGV